VLVYILKIKFYTFKKEDKLTKNLTKADINL